MLIGLSRRLVVALLVVMTLAAPGPGDARAENWSVTVVDKRAREAVLVEGAGQEPLVLYLDQYGRIKLAAGERTIDMAKGISDFNWAGRGVCAFERPLTDEYGALYAWVAGREYLVSDRMRDFALPGDGRIVHAGGRDLDRFGLFVWRPEGASVERGPGLRPRAIIREVEAVEAGLAGVYFNTFRPANLYLLKDDEVVHLAQDVTYLADSPGGLVLCEDRRSNKFLCVGQGQALYPLMRGGKLVGDAAGALGDFKVVAVDRGGQLVEMQGGQIRIVAPRGSHGMLSHFAFDRRGRYGRRPETFAVLEADAPVVFRDDRQRLWVRTRDRNVEIARNVSRFVVDLRDNKVLFSADRKLHMLYQGSIEEVADANCAFAPLVGRRLLFVDGRRDLYLYAEGQVTALVKGKTLDAASLFVDSGNPGPARKAFQRHLYVDYETAGLDKGRDVALVSNSHGVLYLLRRID